VRTDKEEVEGELVVMAGGRGASLKGWLGEGGYHLPSPELVDVGQINAACVYRLPPTFDIKVRFLPGFHSFPSRTFIRFLPKLSSVLENSI
jgi:hypothetical protein